MKYAKLVEGQPIFAPNPIHINDLLVGNPKPEMLTEEGYKPVRYTEAPTPEPGSVAVPVWTETEEEIVQMWTEEPEPDEVDGERAMQILFEEGDGDGK